MMNPRLSGDVNPRILEVHQVQQRLAGQQQPVRELLAGERRGGGSLVRER